ncbi:MAG: hypothetical protein AAGC64_07705 [Bacteroidota bacterium]
MDNFSFIVGDAGGTGTQWRVVNEGKTEQFETIGFNAYTHNLDDFKTSILQVFGDRIKEKIPKYLYAAGIDTDTQKADVTHSLSEVFLGNVYVENDLIGVARSLCGKEQGNICILGTGSNACFYDGEKVSKISASLGYVLGDEGSGAYLGKKLMMGVFRENLSKDLIDDFQNEYQLTAHSVIERIYHQPRPNHFLASFARFIHKHRSYPEIYQLVFQAFNDFFDAFFFRKKRMEIPFYFSGSIAYYFTDALKEVGVQRGITIKKIVQSPVAGLLLYHQQYG